MNGENPSKSACQLSGESVVENEDLCSTDSVALQIFLPSEVINLSKGAVK